MEQAGLEPVPILDPDTVGSVLICCATLSALIYLFSVYLIICEILVPARVDFFSFVIISTRFNSLRLYITNFVFVKKFAVFIIVLSITDFNLGGSSFLHCYSVLFLVSLIVSSLNFLVP